MTASTARSRFARWQSVRKTLGDTSAGSIARADCLTRLAKRRAAFAAATATVGFVFVPVPALAGSAALPAGGTFTSGAGTLVQAGTHLDINQSTTRAIINWNSFSVGELASVSFQNGSGATLNRVIGDAPSAILGAINASGSVYLINSAGILIGHNAVINARGGFVASTLDMEDTSFMKGGSFVFSGNSTASVVNLGQISSSAGDVYLIARNISNQGSLTAAGTIGLAAGTQILLQDGSGDQRVFIQVGSDSNLTTSGAITAASVELRAAGGNIYALAGNGGGVIAANAVANRNGKVWLVADGGDVTVGSGSQITAAGTTSAGGVISICGGNSATIKGALATTGTVGGQIETSGGKVNFSGATINPGVGGRWLLDPASLTIDAAAAATITTTLNNGSNVTQQTSAGGGAGTGDILVTSNIGWNGGASLTLSAYHDVQVGSGITISNGNAGKTGAGILQLLADNTGTGSGTVSFGAGAKVDFTNSSGQVLIGYNPLDGAASNTVNSARYTSTIGYSGGSAGYVSEVLLGSHGAGLTAAMIVTSAEDLQNVQNNLSANYLLQSDIDASATAGWNAGAGFASLGSSGTAFTGALLGNGHTVDQLMINRPNEDHVGLISQLGAGGTAKGLTLTNVAVTGGNFVGGLVGTSAGSVQSVSVTGSVTGSAFVGGIVGQSLGSASGVTGSHNSSTVVGANSVGGIVGQTDGTISASDNAGTISGDLFIGGIAGSAGGSVSGVSNTGAITGNSSSVGVGGILGFNTGTASAVSNTGAVSGSYSIGGVVGDNGGAVSNANSAGTISGFAIGSNIGGVIGLNEATGTIRQSYSTGPVTTAASFQGVGGLVGENDGAVNLSYSTGTVAAGSDNALIGGLIGKNLGQVIQSYASSTVSGGANSVDLGGLVGDNEGSVSQSFAYGTVSGAAGASSLGGLFGTNSGTVSADSFWDIGTTGQAAGAGGGTAVSAALGLTTAQAQNATLLAGKGYNFNAGPWVILDGKFYPLLSWRYAGSMPQIIAGTAYKDSAGMLAATGSTISLLEGGTQLAQATSAASGYYYFLLDNGTVTSGSALLTTVTGASFKANAAETFLSGTATGMDLLGNTVSLYGNGAAIKLSDLVSAKASSTSTDIIYASAGSTLTPTAGKSLRVVGNGSAIDVDLSATTSGAGTITMGGATNLTLDAGVTLTSAASGTAIALAAQNQFTNNSGAGALVTSAGHWLVTALDPTTLAAGGLTPDFLQYGTSGPLLGSGNGFRFVTVPTLTVSLTGTVSKTYDSNSTATLSNANYSVAGDPGWDTVALTMPGIGAFADKNAGSGKLVSVSGLTVSATNGLIPVYGYTLTATSASAAIGTITQASLTAGLTGTVSKTYDTTTTATLSASNYALGGVLGSDSVAIAQTSGSYDTKNAGTGKTVSVTGLTLSGADAGNYTLAATSASSAIGTITQASLTAGLTGTVSKTYDATTSATLASANYSLGGVLGSDSVSLGTPVSGSYDTKNAGTGKLVSVTGLTLGGADAGNYALTATSASAAIGTITQASLTAGLTGTVSKTYDATTGATLVAGNYTLGGAIGGDAVALNDPASGSYDTKNAGTGKIVSVTGLTLSGADAGNYALTATSASAAIGTINKASLTAGLTGTVSKTYDTSTSATLAASNYTLGGTISGDAVALNDPVSGSYDTRNAGTGKIVSVSGLTLSGADAGNYTLTVTSASAAIGTITQASLTAGLTGTVSKTYDATTSAALASANYSLGGVLGSDSVSLGTPVSGSYDTKNAGTGKLVSVTGLTLGGADAGNYTLTATSASAAIGTITQASLTAGLTGTVSKTYDTTTTATLSASNYALGGVLGSDSVAIAQTSGSYDTKNAGTGKTVSVTGLTLSGADAGNYTLAATSASSAIGTITQASLTAGLTGTVSKTYDATTSATLASANYSLGGVLGSDSVSLGTPVSGSYDTKNAGTGKLVSVTGLTLGGADAGNYALTATSASAAIGTITQASLTAGLTGTVSKTYDATTGATLVAGNYTLGGAIGGDAVALNDPASGSYDTKNAGTGKIVSVTGLTLSGADAGNYALTATSASAAIGTINKASLTAGLTGTVSKTYDTSTSATLAASNYTLGGTISGDAVALNDPVSGSYDTRNAGTGKIVSVSGLTLSGADAGNYTLTVTSASAAIGKITQASLTAGLTGTVSKTYDATTSAALASANYSLGGVLGSDSVSLGTPVSGSYDTKNAGTGKLVSVTGLTLGGADAGNYTLTATSASAAIGTITQASLTAGLTGTVSKTYDTTTTATLSASNYALGGVLGSDSVAIAQTSGSYDTKNAGTGKTVSVTGLTLSGADAGNYTLAATSASSAIGTITQASLTAGLTGTVSKTYDATTSATLASANYSLGGVLGSDSVSLGTPVSGSYDTKNAGTGKLVSVTGLTLGGADAGNYALTATSASAAIGTITQASLTAGLTGTVSKTYDATTGATLVAGNYTLGGAIGGDAVALNDPASGSYDTKNAGTGKIVSVTGLTLSGADAGNYALTATSASAAIGTINKASATITVDNTQRFVNVPNPPFTVTYSGFVGGETSSALSGSLQFTTAAATASPPGIYAVSASGLSSNNYNLKYVDGQLSVIAQATNVQGDGQTPTSFVIGVIHTPLVDILSLPSPDDQSAPMIGAGQQPKDTAQGAQSRSTDGSSGPQDSWASSGP
ncbi:YDG domain-containing protein [Novosphingobium sp.]|uniref:YDG domain-containing protein n=1 Tax=Novosphingobium sp. TaxID=1874826 RepID=UPI003B52AFC2